MAPVPALVVVLTGGTARRLGGVDKTAIDVGGRSVLQRLVDGLRPWPVVVVGPRQDVVPAVLWTREEPAGSGPFAGAAAGVAAGTRAHPGTEVVVVLAGDQPFAAAAVAPLLSALEEAPAADAALARGPDGRAQPLLAAYRLTALGHRLTGEVRDRPARLLADGLRTVLVDVGAATALDVDDADDLAAARRVVEGVSRSPDAGR
ncbi:molybdenum cofactor guanylyltransferase [Cellulomonas phragmiteti]|uniref:molybdenum cofactor guanylyltransferase n=1 Tax=Cellulomonas phragmiteti TaxID=478780 RepID=UPI0019451980|nr:nucleotidyltransferase family protein [Cellulomonas phragmiteti]